MSDTTRIKNAVKEKITPIINEELGKEAEAIMHDPERRAQLGKSKL
jgi:hypothetical protein